MGGSSFAATKQLNLIPSLRFLIYCTSSSNCLVRVSHCFLVLINSWRDSLITIWIQCSHLLQCLYLLLVWDYFLWRSELVREKFLSCCGQFFTHLFQLQLHKITWLWLCQLHVSHLSFVSKCCLVRVPVSQCSHTQHLKNTIQIPFPTLTNSAYSFIQVQVFWLYLMSLISFNGSQCWIFYEAMVRIFVLSFLFICFHLMLAFLVFL